MRHTGESLVMSHMLRRTPTRAAEREGICKPTPLVDRESCGRGRAKELPKEEKREQEEKGFGLSFKTNHIVKPIKNE